MTDKLRHRRDQSLALAAPTVGDGALAEGR